MSSWAILLAAEGFQLDAVFTAPDGTEQVVPAFWAGENLLAELARFCFWTSMLSGCLGHTYGAQGVWQFATPEELGVDVGGNWGDAYWQDAYRLPGSGQMGIGKRLLERYPWWEFEPRREPDWNEQERISPFTAGIPRKVWVMYLATDSMESKYWGFTGKSLRIEPEMHYRAYFFNPRTD